MFCSTALGLDRIQASGLISTSAKDVFVSRYTMLRSALVCLLDRYKVEAVGIESPPFGEQWSEGLYALFVYLNEALYLARKDVVYFDPLTLKMLAKMDPNVRRGTMDKLDMVEAVKAEVGKRLNHNIADAYLVGRSAARFWEFEKGIITKDELTPAEAHSFHRVHTYVRGDKAGRTVHKGLAFREGDRFFRFSSVPLDPEEEEFRQWLCQRGSKVVAAMATKQHPLNQRKQ